MTDAIEKRDLHQADWAAERIIQAIIDFEASLSPEHEAGIVMTNSGQPIRIDSIGYHNPNLIFLHGTLNEGSEVQIIQHVSQINLCLVKVPARDPESPRRKIGFVQDE